MKTIKTLCIAAIFSSLLFQACTKEGGWSIEGKGEQVTEIKNLSDFEAIDLSIDAHVSYTQDVNYKIEIRAQQNIHEAMDVKVKENELQLDFKRNVRKHDGIEIIIHSPKITEMRTRGSGNITVINKIEGSNLRLDISGSGSITIPTVTLQNLDVKISGSGDLYINGGTCAEEHIDISGSGNAETYLMSAVNADVDISGSGEAFVNVVTLLNVEISGQGKVKYKGNPTLSKNITGSGEVIHVD